MTNASERAASVPLKTTSHKIIERQEAEGKHLKYFVFVIGVSLFNFVFFIFKFQNDSTSLKKQKHNSISGYSLTHSDSSVNTENGGVSHISMLYQWHGFAFKRCLSRPNGPLWKHRTVKCPRGCAKWCCLQHNEHIGQSRVPAAAASHLALCCKCKEILAHSLQQEKTSLSQVPGLHLLKASL